MQNRNAVYETEPKAMVQFWVAADSRFEPNIMFQWKSGWAQMLVYTFIVERIVWLGWMNRIVCVCVERDGGIECGMHGRGSTFFKNLI